MLMMAAGRKNKKGENEDTSKYERGRTDEFGWVFCYVHNVMESGE